jgi:hypothetical protein
VAGASVVPVGVEAVFTASDVFIALSANIQVSGVQSVFAVGNVAVTGAAPVVLVDGTQARFFVSSPLVWGLVDDNQVSQWQNIGTGQLPDWVVVPSGQSANWTNV